MVSAILIWQAFFGIRQPKSSSVMSVSIAWKFNAAIFTLTPWRCLKWRTQLLSYCFHCQLKCGWPFMAWNVTVKSLLEIWLLIHGLKCDGTQPKIRYFMDNHDSNMVSAKLIWQAFFGIRQPKSSSVMSVSIAWKYEAAIFTLTPWRCLKWRTQLLSYCFHCQLF